MITGFETVLTERRDITGSRQIAVMMLFALFIASDGIWMALTKNPARLQRNATKQVTATAFL